MNRYRTRINAAACQLRAFFTNPLQVLPCARLYAAMALRGLWLLLTTADPKPVEGFAGGVALFWGLDILLPFNSFASTASFRVMAALMPEWAWGWMVFLLGVSTITSAALARSQETPRRFLAARLWCARVGILVWGSVVCALGFANILGTGVVTYSCFAVACIWVWARLDRA